MAIENDATTAQITQKKEWEQPELTELDMNKTESGDVNLVEIINATGSLTDS
ncbi:MAG: hypothetical protein PHO65_01950 [Sulfurovum sp.]|nr:hypothetical protein [Sulfurovum sp.]